MFKNYDDVVDHLRATSRRLSALYFLLGIAIGFGLGRLDTDAMGFVSMSSTMPVAASNNLMNYPAPCPDAKQHLAKRVTEAWVCVADEDQPKEK